MIYFSSLIVYLKYFSNSENILNVQKENDKGDLTIINPRKLKSTNLSVEK